MKNVLLFSMLLASFHSFASTKLIGGVRAKEGEFRSTVSIDDSCTGSKIGHKTFLFAAHCMVDPSMAQVGSGYVNGARVTITTHYGVSALLTVEAAYPHATYLKLLRARLDNFEATSGGGLQSYDIGVFTVLEATPNIPVATVDYSRVEANETIVIGGYGCQTTTNAPFDSGPYKIARVASVHTDVIKGDITNRDISHAGEFNFYTTGRRLRPNAASICQGDSGGPAYRDKNNQVVGVNSQYIFNDKSGLSVVNTHTRVSQVKDWLQAIIK